MPAATEEGAWNEFVATMKDLTAGTIGGCSGIVVGQPLDTIKVRLQSQKGAQIQGPLQCAVKMYQREGILSFYKGLLPPLLGNAPINAICFACYGNMYRLLEEAFPSGYENVEYQIKNLDGSQESMSVREEQSNYTRIYLAGSWAGLVQCFVATPAELLKCKLQVQDNATGATAVAKPKYTGMIDCARQVYRSNGFTGLFRGWWATVARDLPAWGVYFLAYEWTKDKLRAPKNGVPGEYTNSVPSLLIAGGVAGFLTWGCSYPFDVLKSVIQVLPDQTPVRERKMMYVAKHYYQQYGWRFFFRGLGTTLLRSVPVNAVTFYIYELSLKGFELL